MFFLSPSELKIGLETELELFNRLVCLAWRVWCANFGCFGVFSRYLIKLVGVWSFVVQKFDDPQFFSPTNVISKVYGDTPIFNGLVFNPFPL